MGQGFQARLPLVTASLILLAKVIFAEIISNTMTKNLNFSY